MCWFVRVIALVLEKVFFRYRSQMSAYYVENSIRSNRFQGGEKQGQPWNKVASWIIIY